MLYLALFVLWAFAAIVSFGAEDDAWDDRFGFGVGGLDGVGQTATFAGNFYCGGRTVSKLIDGERIDIGRTDGDVTDYLSTSNFLYVGGTFTSIGNLKAHGIAAWDGSKWNTVGNPGEEIVGYNGLMLAKGAGGSLLVSPLSVPGQFMPARIWQWNGRTWSKVGTEIKMGSKCAVECLAASSKGDIYAIVYFEKSGTPGWGKRIVKLVGEEWKTLAKQPASFGAHSIAVSPSDELYCAGELWGETPGLNGVARWTGSKWEPLGGGLLGYGKVIRFQGKSIVVGGCFSRAGSVASAALARWDGVEWHGYGKGMSGGGVIYAMGKKECVASDMTSVSTIALLGEKVLVTGGFNRAGDIPAAGIALWDGKQWQSVDRKPRNGVSKAVRTLLAFGTNLCAGGDFNSAGDVRTDGFAWWDGQGWQPQIHFGGSAFDALASDGSVIFGTSAGDVYRMEQKSWSPLTMTTDHSVLGGALAAGGGRVYVGGRAIFKLDGTHWSFPGAGLQGRPPLVKAIAVARGGDVYAGGLFEGSGKDDLTNVARWDGKTWNALGKGAYSESGNAQVKAIAVRDTNVFVGGDFIMAGDDKVNGIARWDGIAWHPLAGGVSGVGTNFSVQAIVCDGHDVYVGGNFTRAGTVPARNIARWDGQAWHSLGSGIDGPVLALAIQDDKLWVGGEFGSAGSKPSVNIACWSLRNAKMN